MSGWLCSLPLYKINSMTGLSVVISSSFTFSLKVASFCVFCFDGGSPSFRVPISETITSIHQCTML